jgi:hypothetical protein
MKKILSLITLITCVQTINAQTPSSCIVPQVLQSNYDLDVKHLTLVRLAQTNSPYLNSIVIPQICQDSIMEGMAAIFNLPNIYDRDSVFDKYCIHECSCLNKVYKRINVGINTTYGWTSSWQSLQTITGISPLDNLLSTYGFTVTNYSSFAHYATLTTTQSLNVLPLCDSIATFGGVNYAEPAYPAGDGDKILYSISGNIKYYDFSIGWSDCYSGCINRHTWKYKVNPDCSVEFLGEVNQYYSSSEPYPTPTNCNITVKLPELLNSKISANIFPVPSRDFITIELNNISEVNFRLIDYMGKTINSGKIIGTVDLNVKNLFDGLYFIQLCDNKSNTLTYKIIKE